MSRPREYFTGRELTDFEIEHGTTPCPFTFCDPSCGIVSWSRYGIGDCAKTMNACRSRRNQARFGGLPIVRALEIKGVIIPSPFMPGAEIPTTPENDR